MTQAHDGLNHQGCRVGIIDIESLQLIKHYVTSSHSFGNSLAVRKNGKFYGIDLGDNGPRRINYWNFD